MSYRVRRVWEYRLRNYFANTQAALERAQAAAAQRAAEQAEQEEQSGEQSAEKPVEEISADMLRSKNSGVSRVVYPSNAYNLAINNARDKTKYATYITTYNKGFERDSY